MVNKKIMEVWYLISAKFGYRQKYELIEILYNRNNDRIRYPTLDELQYTMTEKEIYHLLKMLDFFSKKFGVKIIDYYNIRYYDSNTTLEDSKILLFTNDFDVYESVKSFNKNENDDLKKFALLKKLEFSKVEHKITAEGLIESYIGSIWSHLCWDDEHKYTPNIKLMIERFIDPKFDLNRKLEKKKRIRWVAVREKQINNYDFAKGLFYSSDNFNSDETITYYIDKDEHTKQRVEFLRDLNLSPRFTKYYIRFGIEYPHLIYGAREIIIKEKYLEKFLVFIFDKIGKYYKLDIDYDSLFDVRDRGEFSVNPTYFKYDFTLYALKSDMRLEEKQEETLFNHLMEQKEKWIQEENLLF